MTDKVDLALEDVVKMDKKPWASRGGGGGGGRGGGAGGKMQRGGGRQQVRAMAQPYARVQQQQFLQAQPRGRRGGMMGGGMATFAQGGGGFFMHEDRTMPQQSAGLTSRAHAPTELSTGTKMLVSGLGTEVTDEDLEELFTTNGGPVKKAEVFYKQDGTSTGTAEIIFKARASADKVLKTLQGVPLDGKPLQLALVGLPSAAPVSKPTQVTITGLAPGGGFGGYGGGFAGGNGGGFAGGYVPRGGMMMRGGRGAARGGGGRGGARVGGRGGGGGGRKPTQLDNAALDKGMDDYFDQ